MKKFFKALNKEILKTNHPKGIAFINDKGPKQIYKIVPRIDALPEIDIVEQASDFRKEISYVICTQQPFKDYASNGSVVTTRQMAELDFRAHGGEYYIYDHNARQRKLEELRRRKYDPLGAIASAKAMEEARKEKAKREAQPKKEDFYPSDDEEETTITSTPAPTVDSSKDFNLMSDRQTSTTSFDDWIKSQQRKKAAAKEQVAATQTIKEEPVRESKDLKTQVSEETFIKENPELEKVVNDLVEAAIRKIETEKKRLEN